MIKIDCVKEKVMDEFVNSVCSLVRNLVDGSVRNLVDDSVHDPVRTPVVNSVWGSVGDTIIKL